MKRFYFYYFCVFKWIFFFEIVAHNYSFIQTTILDAGMYRCVVEFGYGQMIGDLPDGYEFNISFLTT